MATLKSEAYEAVDIDEFTEMAYRKGWTDGLPVLPPTTKAVTLILDYLQRDPDEVIGVLSPAEGIATIEKVAINCAMAACKPEYVPIVITAIEAMLEDEFEHMRVNCTTGGPAPATIVSGPIVEELGFNYGEGAVSGSGNRVNSTIGRAIRLVLWNIAQSRPGELSGATYGHIGRMSYLLAERPADDGNPWEPFHVTSAGFEPRESSVTMFPSGTQDQISAGTGMNSIEEMVGVLADSITLGDTQKLLVINPYLASALADAGWSKRDLRNAILESANPWSPGTTTEAHYERREYTGELRIPSATGPRLVKEELHILVTGGWSQAPSYCLLINSMHGQLVTRRID